MAHLPLWARFNAWANERLYDSVARLPDAAYRAERNAFFGSIHRTLNHLLVVDRLWTVFFLEEIGAAGPPGTLAPAGS